MVFDGNFATYLKMLNIADLLDGTVILLNMPELVMLFGECFPVTGGKLLFISQEDGVMARLVFQPRPKQLHMTELLEPNDQAVVRDVQLLHLYPLTFFQGNRTVAFQREELTQLMVSDPFQVVHATVPTVPSHHCRLKPPSQHLVQHVLEIIVDGQMLAMDISVIQGDEVDALHRTMMLARPKITDKRQVLAVRLVQDAVIDTQHAILQVQEGAASSYKSLPS